MRRDDPRRRARRATFRGKPLADPARQRDRVSASDGPRAASAAQQERQGRARRTSPARAIWSSSGKCPADALLEGLDAAAPDLRQEILPSRGSHVTRHGCRSHDCLMTCSAPRQLLLVLLNAFFVASEFAMVKMRPTRLEQLVRERRRARAARAADLAAPRRVPAPPTSSASRSRRWPSAGSASRRSRALLEPRLAALGAWAASARTAIARGARASSSITALHTVIGEHAPKSLAIQRTEQVALCDGAPAARVLPVLWPAIWLLNDGSRTRFVRLFGLGPCGEEEMAHTSEELRMLLTRSPAGLDPDDAQHAGAHLRSAPPHRAPRDDACATTPRRCAPDMTHRRGGEDRRRRRLLALPGARRRRATGARLPAPARSLRGARAAGARRGSVAELLRKPIFARESTRWSGSGWRCRRGSRRWRSSRSDGGRVRRARDDGGSARGDRRRDPRRERRGGAAHPPARRRHRRRRRARAARRSGARRGHRR